MRLRSFLFAAKIAALFILLLGLSLGGALVLFMRVAAPELARDIGKLRAFEASRAADRLESTLAQLAVDGEPRLDDPAVADVLRRIEAESGLQLEIGPETRAPALKRTWRSRFHPPQIAVRGRDMSQLGPPAFDLFVPLRLDGEAFGHVRVRGPSHAIRIHLAFERGLLRIAGLSLFSVVILSIVLTRPLRRMSRSMDRVAAGELGHRVRAQGRDEVAAMGRSFNAMADRIQEMIRGQQEMLAGVSHELRSPLGRMKMILALMRDAGGRSDVDAGRLRSLDEEIDHLDGLIQEILTATRLDFGGAPLQLESLELAAVVEGAWAATALAADPAETAERGPSLDLDVERLTVRADPKLLPRVIGNLLANARRYARDTVQVRARRRGDRIEVTVGDDGPGVPDEQLERLFEPFFRADAARAHGDHVGMGLAIVRKATLAHGGRARARRSDLGGLEVTVDFEDGFKAGVEADD
ncbi:MAG: ATP-binding protein [Acidobacteriota bacterium]